MSAAEDGSTDVSVEAFSISAPKVCEFYKVELRFRFSSFGGFSPREPSAS